MHTTSSGIVHDIPPLPSTIVFSLIISPVIFSSAYACFFIDFYLFIFYKNLIDGPLDDLVTAVHVKFRLRQSCEFGEQFLLVGEDTKLGSWKPGSATPMEWSDGDVWTVEMDLPVGKEIKFKFILRELSGGIKWQPGPDRVLQTWETINTIVVTHDWENAEDQIISEERLASLATTQGEEEAFEETTTATDGEDTEKQVVTSGSEIAEEKTVGPAGDRVLVPGLMRTGEIDDGIAEQEASEATALEAASEAPVEDEHAEAVSRDGRQLGETDPQRATGSATEEEKEPASAGGILENDIQWGRETLQKFLSNMGFYQRGST
ncbi:unnamed protein product [Spirodela intermedia]|uniref:CBM20 domain-containing protein n=1 Tax=Spirodela intermedia TaxID=51605 RepID=A0A7I8IC21_SPIIN|nr:unnamed protein product [Spirodela intermedia]CAA6655138.1 unnamed protein product [Spirodela intermedia]